jgi:hypothetical protein
VFFAIAQCFGSFGAWFYPHLIGQSRNALFVGYLIGAGVMAFGGIVEIFLGVSAEQKSLEDVATPISAEAAEGEGAGTKATDLDGDDERAKRQRAAAERSRRIQERTQRRQAWERTGRRRYRPGPGSRMYAPMMAGTWSDGDAAADMLEPQIEAIERALSETGPTDRRRLAQLVGARYWGPGRFGLALQEAVREGRVQRVGRNTVAPVER